MDEFISSHPSDYAKFRLCENKTNPQPCKGFWPVLFDYRGKSALSGVEASIGPKGGAYKVLASILSDAYTFYGVSSIKIKKIIMTANCKIIIKKNNFTNFKNIY